MNTANETILKTHPQVNPTPSQILKFWKNVDKVTTPNGCWEWIGCRDKSGYGRIGLNYKIHFAHRISFFLETGKWPGGKMVCHHCDNPSCCNPNHIYEGTAKTNTRDAILRKRVATGDRHGSRTHPERIARGDRHGTRIHQSYLPKGEDVWCSKLSENQIIQIRRIYMDGKFKQWQIAEKFKVGQPTINKIVNFVTWKHIK